MDKSGFWIHHQGLFRELLIPLFPISCTHWRSPDLSLVGGDGLFRFHLGRVCRFISSLLVSDAILTKSEALRLCFLSAFRFQFSGQSIGIVGLGRIGSAIAKRAEAFGCPISYHSRSEKPRVSYKYYPSAVELARHCRILVVACALTEETRHIIGREVLDALGPEGVLINIGRGAHVDEPELVSALVEGRLGGAGLDVFENEPEVAEELLRMDNVVLLPHVGSDTVETSTVMADLVLANLEAHFAGNPLPTPVI